MRRFAAGLLCLLAMAATAAAQSSASWPKAWNLAHPNATALIGIDVRGIRDSALGESLKNQFKDSASSLPAMQGDRIPAIKDFLSNIDSVFISSPGSPKPSATAAKPGGAYKNPAFLCVVSGHFLAAQLGLFLQGQRQTYNTVDIYRPEPKNDTSLALLDENTLLLGDAASLRAAIDRHTIATAAPAPLLARAAALAAANDIWMIVAGPPSLLQANLNFGAMMSDVTGLEFGMSLRDNLRLELTLATKDPASAQRLAQMISSQIQLAMAAKTNSTQSAEMLRKLQINAEGNKVTFRGESTREEVERSIHEMQQSLRSGADGGARLKPPARPASPPPGTIRIYGEPGGTREIPAGPPPQ